jgi:cation diffusion facilitator CzcD-associated flavoprotein CzcO
MADLPQVVCNGAGPYSEEPAINGTIDQAAPTSPYRVLDQYHSRPRKVKVACAGAGASGLCLAYKIKHMLAPDSWELTIFEKNKTVGGTWHENTYPGVACDIPAHIYSFTFDPKSDWSHYYAYGAEIQRYFEGFADRHECRKYIKFQSKVVAARWQPDDGVWAITIQNTETGEQGEDWAHFFINGSGQFHFE